MSGNHTLTGSGAPTVGADDTLREAPTHAACNLRLAGELRLGNREAAEEAVHLVFLEILAGIGHQRRSVTCPSGIVRTRSAASRHTRWAAAREVKGVKSRRCRCRYVGPAADQPLFSKPPTHSWTGRSPRASRPYSRCLPAPRTRSRPDLAEHPQVLGRLW